MARNIKILKCPKCGSNDKTDLKSDVFQCNSCKTIYYLENDDIDVNTYESRIKSVTSGRKHTLLTIAVGIGVVILLITLFLYFQLKKDSDVANVVAVPSTTKKVESDYWINNSHSFNLVQPGTGKPIVLTLESRTYNHTESGAKPSKNYLIFYDPLEKQTLKETELDPVMTFKENPIVREFSNQRIYMISSPEIYELDMESLSIRPVGKELFSDIAKVQDGLSSLKFTDYGDGLELITNENKLFYYFPIIKKTYSAAAFEKASQGFNTLLPGAKEVTYHQFTESRNEYSNYKLQLLRIRYLDNNGGPKTLQKFFIWSKSYVLGEGYRICLVIPDLKEVRRIVSHKDFTPGRNYYEPLVVYEDQSTLLIRFRASASEGAPYKLQRLDRKTGAVIWTTPLAMGEDLKKLYRYKDFYYSFDGKDVQLFDLNGNYIKN